jgi:hypothetical protein
VSALEWVACLVGFGGRRAYSDHRHMPSKTIPPTLCIAYLAVLARAARCFTLSQACLRTCIGGAVCLCRYRSTREFDPERRQARGVGGAKAAASSTSFNGSRSTRLRRRRIRTGDGTAVEWIEGGLVEARRSVRQRHNARQQRSESRHTAASGTGPTQLHWTAGVPMVGSWGVPRQPIEGRARTGYTDRRKEVERAKETARSR